MNGSNWTAARIVTNTDSSENAVGVGVVEDDKEIDELVEQKWDAASLLQFHQIELRDKLISSSSHSMMYKHCHMHTYIYTYIHTYSEETPMRALAIAEVNTNRVLYN